MSIFGVIFGSPPTAIPAKYPRKNFGFRASLYFKENIDAALDLKFFSTATEDLFIHGYSVNHSEVLSNGESSQVISKLEGEFVALFHNKVSDEVFLFNDRFGARPLFYYCQPDRECVFASNNLFFLFEMASLRPRFDDLGVFQLLKYNHCLGARTTFQDVSKLAPGHFLHLLNGKVRIEQYWKLDYAPDAKFAGCEARAVVAEAFREAGRARVNAFPDRKVFFGLSGGLDSRFLAASIPKELRSRCVSMTSGESYDSDMIVGPQVAHKLGYQHEFLRIQNTPLKKIAQECLKITGGQTPLHAAAPNLLAADLARGYGGVFFGGWPGDVLVGSYIGDNPLFNSERFRSLMWRAFIGSRGLDTVQLREVYDPKTLRDLEELNRLDFMEFASSLSAPTAAHLISAWAMVKRQTSFTFMTPVHALSDVVSITPFLGYAYTDLILKLTADNLFKKKFYKEMIYQSFPELREVPYGNTGENLLEFYQIQKPIWKDYVRAAFLPQMRRFKSMRSRTLTEGLAYHKYLKESELLEMTIDSLSSNAELFFIPKLKSFIESFRESPGSSAVKIQLASSVISLALTAGLLRERSL